MGLTVRTEPRRAGSRDRPEQPERGAVEQSCPTARPLERGPSEPGTARPRAAQTGPPERGPPERGPPERTVRPNARSAETRAARALSRPNGASRTKPPEHRSGRTRGLPYGGVRAGGQPYSTPPVRQLPVRQLPRARPPYREPPYGRPGPAGWDWCVTKHRCARLRCCGRPLRHLLGRWSRRRQRAVRPPAATRPRQSPAAAGRPTERPLLQPTAGWRSRTVSGGRGSSPATPAPRRRLSGRSTRSTVGRPAQRSVDLPTETNPTTGARRRVGPTGGTAAGTGRPSHGEVRDLDGGSPWRPAGGAGQQRATASPTRVLASATESRQPPSPRSSGCNVLLGSTVYRQNGSSFYLLIEPWQSQSDSRCIDTGRLCWTDTGPPKSRQTDLRQRAIPCDES